MPEFKAYFCDERVYIEGQQYRCNEILTACLNLPEAELNACLVSLWRLIPEARLQGVNMPRLRAFLGCIQRSQELFSRLGSLCAGLPVFSWGAPGRSLSEARLPALLGRLCRDGVAGPTEVDDSFSFVDFYFLPVASALSALSGAEAAGELEALNLALGALLEEYIFLAGDLLQARRAYSSLLDGYIHEKRAYLSGDELAACFSRYFRDSAARGVYDKLPEFCNAKSVYEPFTSPEGRQILSMSCTFSRLRDFLYTDFFRGLERSCLPRRCGNCGRYFLLSGKYSCYCESPLPDGAGKTCRSVGARRQYGSKCKNDPVWLIYNRAYKAHYARYMKGKMTSDGFERWSRYAVSLRGQAADGTLSSEQYEKLIKE